jgi:hypothetical protein
MLATLGCCCCALIGTVIGHQHLSVHLDWQMKLFYSVYLQHLVVFSSGDGDRLFTWSADGNIKPFCLAVYSWLEHLLGWSFSLSLSPL